MNTPNTPIHRTVSLAALGNVASAFRWWIQHDRGGETLYGTLWQAFQRAGIVAGLWDSSVSLTAPNGLVIAHIQPN